MTETLCWAIVQRLLENPEAPAADDLRHVHDCERCNSIIARAAKLDSLISVEDEEPTPVAHEQLSERTAKRAATRLKCARLVTDSLVAAFVAIGAAGWFIVAGFYMGRGPFTRSAHPEYLSDALPLLFPVSALLGVVLGLAAGRLCSRRPAAPSVRGGAWLPLFLVIALLGEYRIARFLALHHDAWFAWGIGTVMLTAALVGFLPGRAGLPYKRLRAGRQLSGVCMGIAETTRVPVAIIRLAFVVLFLAKLSGFVLYLVLDLLMEVHPDDRAALLRFRIRRWWDARTGEKEAASA